MASKQRGYRYNEDDHKEEVISMFSDKNRNGMLTLYGLGRWLNVNRKLVLKMLQTRDWGFLLAAHTTFDSLNVCFNQSSLSHLSNASFSKVAYFTETNKSSRYVAKHVHRKSRPNSFIGHEILLSVSINRETRRPKENSEAFKSMTKAMWLHYPYKEKYFELKDALHGHLDELKQIRVKAMNSFLFSHKMQLRYFDEDRNYHLNARKYYVMIEEMLMNYDQNIANGKYLNYSISLRYWNETRVSKYSHCYLHICEKRTVFMKNEKSGNYHMAWDVYGVMSVSNECLRDAEMRGLAEDNKWTHQSGFIVRVVNRKASTQKAVAKL